MKMLAIQSRSMVRWWLPPRAALTNLRATTGILSDSRALSRIRFLRAAERVGLIQKLRTPSTAEELARALNITDVGLLQGLLDVGVAVGELRSKGGRYSMKGSRVRALGSEEGDALRAFTGELADYRGDVYRDLPSQLFGKERGRYLKEYDELIARASRLLEPFIARFVREVVTERAPRTLLEIGCGTGIYVRHAAEACPQLSAVAIDISERVSALAGANFTAWGLANRCTALHADIRQPDAARLDGPFDVVTLHNNVYYFSESERASLFADLRMRLARGGRLVVTSVFAGKALAAAEFDLVLRSTAGCWPLPERTELLDELKRAGFSAIEFHRLAAPPLYGVVADVP
jgi:4-hydroxy-2,2'-bipyrrole-5-carbaldehyde O-methyltransferase